MQERPPAQRLPAREFVRERARQQRGEPRAVRLCPEDLARVGLQRDRLLEHLERMAVHVSMVEAVLLDAPQGLELGQHDRRGPKLAPSARAPGGRPGAAMMRRSSMNTRSAETPPSAGACSAGRVQGLGVGRRDRARPPSARGAERAGDHRRTPAARPSAAAAPRDRRARPAGRSVALPRSARRSRSTVKSRSARSAASEPPRSGSISTCHERSRASTRHAAERPPTARSMSPLPAARAIARAASPGSPSTTMSRSALARPKQHGRAGRPRPARPDGPRAPSRAARSASLILGSRPRPDRGRSPPPASAVADRAARIRRGDRAGAHVRSARRSPHS